MALCPGCAENIRIDELECPRCGAVFGTGSHWQPLCETTGERQRLNSMLAAGNHVHPVFASDRAERAHQGSARSRRLVLFTAPGIVSVVATLALLVSCDLNDSCRGFLGISFNEFALQLLLPVGLLQICLGIVAHFALPRR